MDKTARPSSRSNRCPRPFSGLPAALKMPAGYWIFVPKQVAALLVASDSLFFDRRERLVALVARQSIPAIYYLRAFPQAGGLSSYGNSLTDLYRQSGIYTGRILKGEKPADLPVMQSTKFEFVINLTSKSHPRCSRLPTR